MSQIPIDFGPDRVALENSKPTKRQVIALSLIFAVIWWANVALGFWELSAA